MASRKKIPHPWPRCKTRSYRASPTTQTPLFSNPLMSPFDPQVYHERQICLGFHRILKVVLEMVFSAHYTPIWKLNRISMTIINKVARNCIGCCHRVQRCVTAPYSGVNCVRKRSQDSHVGMFSLWLVRYILPSVCLSLSQFYQISVV